jgi:hypothetical protein
MLAGIARAMLDDSVAALAGVAQARHRAIVLSSCAPVREESTVYSSRKATRRGSLRRIVERRGLHRIEKGPRGLKNAAHPYISR